MRRLYFLVLLLPFALIVCRQVDFTAPTGSEIRLTVQPQSINFSETATLTVTGIRDGGAPLPNGTVIRFVVDNNLGAITPNPVETTNGIATATFIAGQRSGTATITAISGQANSGAVEIAIGEARVARLIATADPAALPPDGGKVQLRAFVKDDQGNPVSGVQVFFQTDNGTLSSHGQAVLTNSAGIARDTLNTPGDATITVTAGDQEDTLAITIGTQIAPVCGSVIAPNPGAVGEQISFVDNSTDEDSSLKTSTWNFGDGRTATGFAVTHSYSNAGTFIVSHTITDTQGLSDNCDPVVLEITEEGSSDLPPLCSFTVTVPSGSSTADFNGTASSDPDGGSIISWDWDFGDSQTGTGSTTSHTYSTDGTFTATLTVTDDEGDTSSCNKSVTIPGP
jgi:PKD repeat protein